MAVPVGLLGLAGLLSAYEVQRLRSPGSLTGGFPPYSPKSTPSTARKMPDTSRQANQNPYYKETTKNIPDNWGKSSSVPWTTIQRKQVPSVSKGSKNPHVQILDPPRQTTPWSNIKTYVLT